MRARAGRRARSTRPTRLASGGHEGEDRPREPHLVGEPGAVDDRGRADDDCLAEVGPREDAATARRRRSHSPVPTAHDPGEDDGHHRALDQRDDDGPRDAERRPLVADLEVGAGEHRRERRGGATGRPSKPASCRAVPRRRAVRRAAVGFSHDGSAQSYGMSGVNGSIRSISSGSCGMVEQLATSAGPLPYALEPVPHQRRDGDEGVVQLADVELHDVALGRRAGPVVVADELHHADRHGVVQRHLAGGGASP